MIENCEMNQTENYLNQSTEKLFDAVEYVGTDFSYKHKVVWKNVIGFGILHLIAFWGAFKGITFQYSFMTYAYASLLLWLAETSITVGAHRCFTHNTFKARAPFKVLLLVLQTMAGQNSMFTWCRDHRLHHLYSDTDADPHNARRGFFFSHMGWLMCKKHPLVTKLGRTVDMSDLNNDWMVSFQRKYYLPLYLVIAILIPVSIPVIFFGENWFDSFLLCYVTRYLITLHATWLVNSAAHIYGTRPYDNKIQPVESWFVSFVTVGEGWHNYHHAFPWDYRAAELPTFLFSQSTYVIKFFEALGLAYDLKIASQEMIKNRINKNGDGSHYVLGNEKAQASVKAFGPVHPFNPTYNSTIEAPDSRYNPKRVLFLEEKTLKRNTHGS